MATHGSDHWAMVSHGCVVQPDVLMGEEVKYDQMDVEEEPSGERSLADSERPEEEDEEDFAGASGAARSIQAPAAGFGCDFCLTCYPWKSDIARVEVDGEELRFHKRSDTTRGLQELYKDTNYTGVTHVKDICFRCAGLKMHADEDKYVDQAKSKGDVKVKRCWKRISDESRNVPGPKKAAKHLARIQTLARQMQDDKPEMARCFETLS